MNELKLAEIQTEAKQLADDLEKFGGVFERRRKYLQLQYQELVNNIFEVNLPASLGFLTSNIEEFRNWNADKQSYFTAIKNKRYYMYRREREKYELLEITLLQLQLILKSMTEPEHSGNDEVDGNHQLFHAMVNLAKTFTVKRGPKNKVIPVRDRTVAGDSDANN